MKGESGNRLERRLGLPGATLMGLGSMIGTGVFVSIGIAAGVAGAAVIPAIVVAALVATCNALSSAQLAASHAVSGGTYEYGYQYLTPGLGFAAGWMFLCAKSASAATAALGFAGYLLSLVGGDLRLIPWLAVGATAVFTLLVLGGIRRSSRMNTFIVSVTLLALSAFIAAGLVFLSGQGAASFPTLGAAATGGWSQMAYATALMFVAFTGYARIATLGEEVREPRTVIPRAIILTLAVTGVLYVLVALVVVGAIGSERLASLPAAEATPLELAARVMNLSIVPEIVALGAVTAMLGVLLNLILGLSRVVLAMGRRRDLPSLFGRVSRDGSAPAPAVVAVGILIALLASLGSVETSWAFSAFTVLVYYAITNLAALRLPRGKRLYPAWISAAGLVACLFLAFWVPAAIWVAGIGLLAAGFVWQWLASRLWSRDRAPADEAS